jgi:hypothetical protein
MVTKFSSKIGVQNGICIQNSKAASLNSNSMSLKVSFNQCKYVHVIQTSMLFFKHKNK